MVASALCGRRWLTPTSMRTGALVMYRFAGARMAVSSTDDVRQVLYRETQLHRDATSQTTKE